VASIWGKYKANFTKADADITSPTLIIILTPPPCDRPSQSPRKVPRTFSTMASMLDSFKTGKVPKPTDLSRKIEVIGAGLGRTGTMSFSAALDKLLNGPVYHSGNMLISDEECNNLPPV
jgi:hypothetical protein